MSTPSKSHIGEKVDKEAPLEDTTSPSNKQTLMTEENLITLPKETSKSTAVVKARLSTHKRLSNGGKTSSSGASYFTGLSQRKSIMPAFEKPESSPSKNVSHSDIIKVQRIIIDQMTRASQEANIRLKKLEEDRLTMYDKQMAWGEEKHKLQQAILDIQHKFLEGQRECNASQQKLLDAEKKITALKLKISGMMEQVSEPQATQQVFYTTDVAVDPFASLSSQQGTTVDLSTASTANNAFIIQLDNQQNQVSVNSGTSNLQEDEKSRYKKQKEYLKTCDGKGESFNTEILKEMLNLVGF